MFLEETAALAFADVDLGRDVLQGDVLHVVILNVGEDVAQAFYVFSLRSWKGRGSGICVGVECQPDLGQKLLRVHFVGGRLLQI